MVVETAKNQIILNQIVGQKKENRQVEADVIVNSTYGDLQPTTYIIHIKKSYGLFNSLI